MKIAIQGHPDRGKEVIQILESLGGKNNALLEGVKDFWYFINSDGHIRNDYQIVLIHAGFKTYTLEEFEKEFPFKIGDEVIIPDYSNKKGTIINIDCCGPTLSYFIKLETGKGIYRSTKSIKLYKEMKEERNITLTLEKAKEWYKKGGELREIALQAFSEQELNPLPRSWEEFCEKYPVKKGESWMGSFDTIYCATNTQDRIYKNWIPSKKSAEAHVAMVQLEQLRNCWWGDWKPNLNDKNQSKYCIYRYQNTTVIDAFYETGCFLSFPTEELAEEFLECFRDLIEQAGDLI